MRNARTCEQQSQVIVNLRNRADRRTRVTIRGLLIDRHGRAQAFDEIDVRLVHLSQELSRVRRQRFHIPALAFGEQRVERERGFAGARQPCEHHHAIAWKLKIHVLQVMLTSALDDDFEVVG